MAIRIKWFVDNNSYLPADNNVQLIVGFFKLLENNKSFHENL